MDNTIKTSNARKKMLLQSIINTFKKREERGIETQSKMMVAAKWWVLSQLQKSTILQFGVAPFLFMFVVLSSLAALFAFFST